MVQGLLNGKCTHKARTALHTLGHDFLHERHLVAQHQVPQPAVVALHHVGTVALCLPVIVVLACQERLVVATQLAVPVVIGYPPHHTVPRAQQHILRQLVHAQIELHIQVISRQISQVEVLVSLFLEGRAHPLGRRELVAVILIVHPVEGVRFLVVCQVLSCRCFLYASVKESHHAVQRLVHLIVLVILSKMLLQVRFLLGITTAIGPKHIFRVVELKSVVKVEVHEVRMVRLR